MTSEGILVSECPIQVQNRAVRGDYRLAVRNQALGRGRARDAGPRRQGGEAADMLIRVLVITRRRRLRRRDFHSRGPGPKTRKKYLLMVCTNLLTCYPAGPADRRVADGRRRFRDPGRAFHRPDRRDLRPPRGGPQPTYRWCRRNHARHALASMSATVAPELTEVELVITGMTCAARSTSN
jgi:hypothetical protein